jgi:hypothetical protein
MRAVSNLNDFLNFDFYSTIYPENDSKVIGPFFNFFGHPIVPLLSVFLYWNFSKLLFSTIKDRLKIQPKGSILQFLTILHSAILAIYSIWTFCGSMLIVFPFVKTNGLYNSLCDVDGKLWNSQNLGFWIIHFYISKYYEFIDTWLAL